MSYTYDRPQTTGKKLLYTIFYTSLMFGALLHLFACGSEIQTAAGILTGASVITDAASVQHDPFNKAKREKLVAEAKTREQAEADKAAWDATDEKIMKVIEGAHGSVKLGAVGLREVQQGLRAKGDLSKWIIPALRTGIQLKELLAGFGFVLELPKAVK